MKKNSKRNVVISSLLAIALSVSVATGATYALFTNEATTDIAITSGKVDVSASISNLSLYSPTSIALDGSISDDTNAATTTAFANGGTATLNDGDLTLANMTPGDKVTFTITVTNNSNVSAKYRTKVLTTSDTGLYEGLSVNIGGKTSQYITDWATLDSSAAGTNIATLDCSVELPVNAGNAYQNKTCTIAYSVEAVQGNTKTDVVTITPENAQTILDSDISNKTLYFTAGDYSELYVRATASASTETLYYNCHIDYDTLQNYQYKKVDSAAELTANTKHGYVRTIENVTFIGESDVNLQTLTAVYANGSEAGAKDTVTGETVTDDTTFSSYVLYKNIKFVNLSFSDTLYLGRWNENPSNFRVSDIEISNCNFYSADDNALEIGAYFGTSVGDITITNSTFKAPYTNKTGLYIKDATGNFTIENNIFTNCGYNGIQLTEETGHNTAYALYDLAYQPKLTMVINGNVFENIYSRPIRLGGCYESGSTIEIEENIFYAPTKAGETQFVKFGTATHLKGSDGTVYPLLDSNTAVVIGANTYYDTTGKKLELTVSSDTDQTYFGGCQDKA